MPYTPSKLMYQDLKMLYMYKNEQAFFTIY